jgi:glycosyltransferase A (GT-A) superfamily protein (DUF2064 family)
VTAIVVVAKAPVPGRSKTRLCPPCTPEEAAGLAHAALVDTLDAVSRTSASRRILALDGAPGPWSRNFEVLPQRGDGLDERLAAATTDVGEACLIVGMDTPQVTSPQLDVALGRLSEPGVDAVLGPAEDGGWWAAGLRRPDLRAFLGVPMSLPSTGAAQRARLNSLGLRVADLPPARDVDRFDDALAVAALAPGTHFATAVRALGHAADGPPARAVMRTREGDALPLDVGRWLGRAGPVDRDLLERVEGPVLDIGCGPGRHVEALVGRGMVALGIDASPAAVRLARDRGVPVLERSVFDRVPGTGRWSTALVLDGSIGIGGDPGALLARLRQLVRPGGRVLAEVTGPGESSRTADVRLECDGRTTAWFPWAVVGMDDLPGLAAATGLRTVQIWQGAGRWFGCLAA